MVSWALGTDEAAVVKRTARGTDEDVFTWLEGQVAETPEVLRSLYARCVGEARAELIKELGDPSPHRLA